MDTKDTDEKSTFLKPWLFQDKPALVAHRGYAKSYPENTFIALDAAVAAGAKFIEFDVQLSKDLIPFLFHDDSFQRTADIGASVFDLNMAQIAEISVGETYRLGDRYDAEKPITLKSVCQHLNRWQDVHSFIEVKQESIERFGLEQVVDSLLKAIKTLESPHTVISFSEDAISLVKELSGKSTGWVIRVWNKQSLELVEQKGYDFVFCNYQKIPKKASIPEGGSSWVLYEVAEATEAAYCRAKGADLIETMAVESMLKNIGGIDSEYE